MKTQECQQCQQDTQHQVERVFHELFEDASKYTCTQCGLVTTVVPYVENLSVEVAAPPQTLADGAMILHATSVLMNGKPFNTGGDINIKINTSRVITMNPVS